MNNYYIKGLITLNWFESCTANKILNQQHQAPQMHNQRFLVNTESLLNNNTDLLGGKIAQNDSNQDSLKSAFYKNIDDITVLQKDAAALCQFVYACDPNRDGSDEIFGTASGTWKPFYIEKQRSPYSSKMRPVLEKFYECNQQPFDNNLELNLENEGLLNWINYEAVNGACKYAIKWMFKEEKVSLENRLADRGIGFFSMIFYKQVSDTMYDIAYVTEGTTGNLKGAMALWDFIMDGIVTDLLQGLSGMSPQYTRSIQNAKILSKICSKNPSSIRNLYFFGHSLGGGLAIVNALTTGHKAIVFNHAGLNYSRKKYGDHSSFSFFNEIFRGKSKNNNDKVISYHTTEDFLTTEKGQGSNMLIKSLLLLCPSHKDGNRITLGKGGHGIVELIDTHYGLSRISQSAIDYMKGF